MRDFGALIALFASSGCDRMFELTSVQDEASGDANGDAPPIGLTVTFGETGSAMHSNVTTDTDLDSQAPTFNFGTSGRLAIDGGTSPALALLRFDVSVLPSQAQIVSASIRLTTGSDSSPDPIVAVRMLEAWEEGSSDGAAGAANWTEARTGQPWLTAGAAPPSRDTATVGSFIPTTGDTSYDVALEPSVVAGWVAGPDQNFGLALVMKSGDGAGIRSSQTSTLSQRPLLTVVFVPP